MKGIAKYFKPGDIESLFYFYLFFVCLSEVFVIFLFKKMSHQTHTPFNYGLCFLVLLIVPLVETFLLGLLIESFNFIFFQNECSQQKNFISYVLKLNPIPFIGFVLFFIYIVMNSDEIYAYLVDSDVLLCKLFIAFFITLLVGLLMLFILKLFLTYKLKLKAMNYQCELKKLESETLRNALKITYSFFLIVQKK